MHNACNLSCVLNHQSTDVDGDPALLKARPLALTLVPPATDEGPLVSSLSASLPPSSSWFPSLPRLKMTVPPEATPFFPLDGRDPAPASSPSLVNLTLGAVFFFFLPGAATLSDVLLPFPSSRRKSAISSIRRLSASRAPFHRSSPPPPPEDPPPSPAAASPLRLSACLSRSISRTSRASRPALLLLPPPPPRSRSLSLSRSTSPIIIASRRWLASASAICRSLSRRLSRSTSLKIPSSSL